MKNTRFVSSKIAILIVLIIMFSSCDSSRIDPFKHIKMLKINESSFQIMYSMNTPISVSSVSYTSDLLEGSLQVTLSKHNEFNRTSIKIKLEDVFRLALIDQVRELLLGELNVIRDAGYTECSRVSEDKSYPVLFGLNVVYFFPKTTDKTLSDVYVFSNLIFNNQKLYSLDARTWTYTDKINHENPIVGDDGIVNQQRKLNIIHTLEINAYTCKDINN